MKENPKSASVVLTEQQVASLWKDIVRKFSLKKGVHLSNALRDSPEKFWREDSVRKKFCADFQETTRFEKSFIELDSGEDAERDISDVYIRNHFIYRTTSNFKYGYLKRMIFYITDKRIDFRDYIKPDPIKPPPPIPRSKNKLQPGLKYLEGYWISYNGNVDRGHLAQCLYYFSVEDNLVKVEKDGYSSETRYSGDATLQGDSSYLLDLIGEKRGLKKFVIADAEKIKPDVLTCISSAFSVDNNQPIISKEILIKLPGTDYKDFSGGVMIKYDDLEESIKKYYQNEETKNVIKAIKDFLGEDEVTCFGLNDLKNIKQRHLDQINNEQIAEPKIIKKQSVYVHFHKLAVSGVPYHRNIIKYFNNEEFKIDYIAEEVQVSDQYNYLKICQYTKEETQKHKVFYEAKDRYGVVDVQPLFPILKDVIDNDMNLPHLKFSNLVMDATTDTFVSNATFINDFSKSRSIAVVFDEKTLKSEIIIDFSSIEDFEKLKIGINKISYHFNEPDEKGKKIVSFKSKNPALKGAILKKIEREKDNASLVVDESFEIDTQNPKIFAIKTNFPSMKDEILYIHFNLDFTQI